MCDAAICRKCRIITVIENIKLKKLVSLCTLRCTVYAVIQSLTEVMSGLAKSDVDGEYERMDVEDKLRDLRLLTSYLETSTVNMREWTSRTS